MLSALALMLGCLDARAAEGAVGLDLLHEAVAAPGARGLAVLTGPLHPGVQAWGKLVYVDRPHLGLGQTLNLGVWNHSGLGGLGWLASSPRVEARLPAGLSVDLDPAEIGVGLAFLPGHRYQEGDSGLQTASDPPELRLLASAALGLSWRISDSPVSLHLRYRVGLEFTPPPALSLPFLPHSTLGLGASWALGARP